jgi:cysteine-rich repeat protein
MNVKLGKALLILTFVWWGLGWNPASGGPQGEAAFQQIKIGEVFPGTAALPYAQFIELRAYAAGQNTTGGHKLFFFNAAGVKVDSVTLTDVLVSANQMRILIMTGQAATLFGAMSDFTMNAVIEPAGGKVCFDETNVDCFAWGNYSGPAAGVGPAYRPSFGLALGKSAQRRLDIAGSAGMLDAGDDRDSCSIDFVSGQPSPLNNLGQSGDLPPSNCGNSLLEGLEQCDDGNTTAGDGCSSTCSDEFCGDGVVQAGEGCDDGNLTNGDGCDAVCQVEPICGNGTVEGSEQCDDGNLTNGDGCNSICHLEQVCGNGVLEGSEQCDDHNTNSGDGCSATCQFEHICGNGTLEPGEECDDNNTTNGDGCNSSCQVEGSCLVTNTGDINNNGVITSADIIALVNYVFKGGLRPQPCAAAGDVNCSGNVNSSDIIFLVNRVFKSGPAPCDVCTLVPGTWPCP